MFSSFYATHDRHRPLPDRQTSPLSLFLHRATITYMMDILPFLRPMSFHFRWKCVFNNLWTLSLSKCVFQLSDFFVISRHRFKLNARRRLRFHPKRCVSLFQE